MNKIRISYGLFSLLSLVLGMCIYLFFRDLNNMILFKYIPKPEFAESVIIQLKPSIVSYVLIYNLTPELTLGWRFRVKSLAFDLRAGWNIASVTWSDMPHTKVATGWTPFPINLTLITGIAWIF
jgi:hypothetical protein